MLPHTMLPEPDPSLCRELQAVLPPERVLARAVDRLGRSADASIYRLVPEVVVRPRTVEQVQGVLACARRHRRAVTFRAAGTSLSGQAVTEGVLVELAHDWGAVRVLEEGRRLWAQPGVTGGLANRLLGRWGYRLGPDPASVEAAMLGGIVANNASGMCCGVRENSYRTLESLTLVLADGTVVDTARPEAASHLPARVREGLERLREEVRGDEALAGLIRRKFARKNTTGYSLNAFVDYEDPAQILARLMVGSQGTLGFVADMVLRTVRVLPARATALLFFPTLREAGAAVPWLAEAGAAALEILDAWSLRSQAEERGLPSAITRDTAALLVELQAEGPAELAEQVVRAERVVGGLRLLQPAAFSSDPVERERHWHLRKGLFPAVGAARPAGTSVVIEDVAVPVERLAEAIEDLQRLLEGHGYEGTAIFGHAKDGNLHFVLAQDFTRGEAVERYGRFMEALVDLVARRYGGALKAEHGSGRNMAPFVRAEWGERAYAVMRRVKALLDPEGVLNPGVVLTEDGRAHLRHLKALPAVSPVVDKCIECGFCEPRCPSRDVTLTPRQRIVVARELARLEGQEGEARHLRESLAREFEYEGLATCIGDSMCATACPVKIDTGVLVKELKGARQPEWAKELAAGAARHFGGVAGLVRMGLRVAGLVQGLPGGAWGLERVTGALHAVAPSVVPRVGPEVTLPRPAAPLPRVPAGEGRVVVYLPTCLTRIFGPLPGEEEVSLGQAVVEVLGAAGLSARVPEGVEGLCCGMPFSSKAFPEAAREAGEAAARAIWEASEEGRWPVLTDASPCAASLGEHLARVSGGRGQVEDFVAFWARRVLPGLGAPRRVPGVAVLHPTCTVVRQGLVGDLKKVAEAHAEQVVVPAAAECCGFGGDRGLLVPEVTAAATAREAAEVREVVGSGEAGYYSTCHTCELGLSRAVGRPYRSIVHLVRDSLRRG